MNHAGDMADLEWRWEESREPAPKKRGMRERTLVGHSQLANELCDLVLATGEKVFEDAMIRLLELRLHGPDYRIKVNAMLRARVTEDESLIALAVREQMRGPLNKNKERSFYEACAIVAADMGVYSQTFEGAIKAVQRIVARHVKAPNALTEY